MPIDKQLDSVENGLKRFESPLERIIFGARWLMAPFYLGLIGSLAVLMFKFIQELIHFFPLVAVSDEPTSPESFVVGCRLFFHVGERFSSGEGALKWARLNGLPSGCAVYLTCAQVCPKLCEEIF